MQLQKQCCRCALHSVYIFSSSRCAVRLSLTYQPWFASRCAVLPLSIFECVYFVVSQSMCCDTGTAVLQVPSVILLRASTSTRYEYKYNAKDSTVGLLCTCSDIDNKQLYGCCRERLAHDATITDVSFVSDIRWRPKSKIGIHI